MRLSSPSRNVFNSRPTIRKTITLTSIIVVVLWVGLTAAWNTRKVQLRMKCLANLQMIGFVFKAYESKFGEPAPSLQSLGVFGILEASHLVCPATKQPYVLARHSEAESHSGRQVLLFEPLVNHGDGANVLFADGDCKYVPKEQFREFNLAER